MSAESKKQNEKNRTENEWNTIIETYVPAVRSASTSMTVVKFEIKTAFLFFRFFSVRCFNASMLQCFHKVITAKALPNTAVPLSTLCAIFVFLCFFGPVRVHQQRRVSFSDSRSQHVKKKSRGNLVGKIKNCFFQKGNRKFLLETDKMYQFHDAFYTPRNKKYI